MCQNTRAGDAPSMRAASYSELGTPRNPARISSTKNGVVFQTSTSTIVSSEYFWSASHAIGCEIRPRLTRTRLITPYTSLNIHDQIFADTTVGIAHGIKTAAVTHPRPRKSRFN